MTNINSKYENEPQIQNFIMRSILFILLGIFAIYYLMPLFVMITTSLKSLEEIRTGSLIDLPREITFDAWKTA